MHLTVLVPTYKRPDYLENCLKGVAAQNRPPDEVVVTVREDDAETFTVLERWREVLPVREVILSFPGVIAALNAGCTDAKGDIVCLTDDDAVPRPDWLERIENTFLSDDRIGAVGGMDILRAGGDIPTSYTEQVGRIMPFGRVVGNHHAGKGPLREVDHLKGVNMSWRVSAAGKKPFITDLRGSGAQVFFELAFCFRLEREGWKIVYDPAILVDHYVAVRFDEDNRAYRTIKALADATFNFYLALLRERRLGAKRSAALIWAGWIGTRAMPGRLRNLLFIFRKDLHGKDIARATRIARTEAKEYAKHSVSFNDRAQA
jgi:glycosyltransferase involved in cell wall biosynthesis